MVEEAGAPDPSIVTPEIRAVYASLTGSLFNEGKRPSNEEMAKTAGLSVDMVKQILDGLEGLYAIYRDDVVRQVMAAYPMAGFASAHRLIKGNGRIAYSPCAMDAVTIGPTVEKDLDVLSSCRFCGKDVRMSFTGNGSKLSKLTPDNIWIWLEKRIPPDHFFPIVCVNTNFFCSEDHLHIWKEQETLERLGMPISVKEAFERTDEWCSFKMYKLIMEGRPWGDCALDE